MFLHNFTLSLSERVPVISQARNKISKINMTTKELSRAVLFSALWYILVHFGTFLALFPSDPPLDVAYLKLKLARRFMGTIT